MNLADEIKKHIKGEVLTDEDSIQHASRDASMFEVRPAMVVRPKDASDIKHLVNIVSRWKHEDINLSLTARNGGTCMSGGGLNEGIIVDMNQLNHIGEVDEKNRLVKIQGGVMHLDLEKATHPKGLFLASYTSSRDICGVGGMIGNDASGEKSVKYGPTSKNVQSLKVVLSDGEEYEFGPLNRKELEHKKSLPTFEGKIYREMVKLLDDNKHLIDHHHPRVKKNSAGYALWQLWDEHHHTFNLARLFVGAQGTLGIVSEAELKLVPFSPASRMIVAPIAKLSDLANVVQTMLKFNPVTCETFDHHTYDLAKMYHAEDASRANVAEGQHMIVFAIYEGDNQQVADTQAGKAKLALERGGYGVSWIDNPESVESYLLIRRKSFKMLLEHPPANTRAMPFIEDTIVDIEHYGEFLAALEAILSEYSLTYTYAGHIGDGSIRLVPLANMEQPNSAETIMEIADRVYDLTLAFGGSIAVDHNDGIIKTPYLEQMYGPEMVTLFAKVKELFDPLNVFNPGKKLGGSKDYALRHIIRENTAH